MASSKWFNHADPDDDNFLEEDCDDVDFSSQRFQTSPSLPESFDSPRAHFVTEARSPQGIIERVKLIKACINFCFRDCEKSEVFYFWMAMLNYLRVWFKNPPRDFDQVFKADRLASIAMDNLASATKNAVNIWWASKTQREDGKSTQELDLPDAETRMHCSFSQLLVRFKPRCKGPWTMIHWQFSELSTRQPQPTNTDPKKPILVGRWQDVCFWPRFFGFNESVEMSTFCHGLYLHLILVEKQKISLSLASFQQLVTLTLRANEKMTVQGFVVFVKRFGTLDKIYKRMTGAAVIKTTPASPDAKDQAAVAVAWPSYFSQKSGDEITALLFPPNQEPARRGSGSGEDEEEYDEDEDENEEGEVKLKFLIRLARDGESFVLHSLKNRNPSKVELINGSYGDLKDKSPPTLRDFLLDYLDPRWTKERQQLLQEQLAWRTQDACKSDQIPTFSELGEFLKFRVHTLFEWITSDNLTSQEDMQAEVDDAIEALITCPPPPNEPPDASETELKAVLDAELPTIQKTLRTFYWNYHNRKNVGEMEAGLRKASDAVCTYLDLPSVTLDNLLRCREFRLFWVAAWELPYDALFDRVMDLTEKLAYHLSRCSPRPKMSSFWLKVASFSLYNKCYDLPTRREYCRSPVILTRLIQIFGKLIYADSSALALSAEFPIIGLFLDLLDSKGSNNEQASPDAKPSRLQARLQSMPSSANVQWDEFTWTINQVTKAATGIRKMVDFLAVVENSNFLEKPRSTEPSIVVDSDKFLNNKFKDQAMRERAVILLLDSGYLEHLGTEIHGRWLARLKKWQDYRKTHPTLDFRNFNYIGKGNRLNALINLSLELVAMIRICLYSVYRSHLLIKHQRWLVQYMSWMLQLPGFDTKFVTYGNLSADKDRLRRVFDMHYAIADFMVRLQGDWNEAPSEFKTLKDLTEKMADAFKYRVVGAEVVTENNKITLYHCQLHLVPEALQQNSNVVGLKEALNEKLEPEDGGRLRQKKLTDALTGLAEMFLHQHDLMGQEFLFLIADHDQLAYYVTLFLVCLANLIVVSSLERQNGKLTTGKLEGHLSFVTWLHFASALFLATAQFLDNEYRLLRKRKTEPENVSTSQGEQETKNEGCWSRVANAFLQRETQMKLRSALTLQFNANIVYVTLALLAVRWPLLLCGSLVMAVFSTDLARTLFRALSQASRGLLMAYAMGLAVVYAFAAVSYGLEFNEETYDFGDTPVNWTYFSGVVIAHIDQGIKDPPDWRKQAMTGRESREMGLFLYSFLYNIIIITVLVAIISGVVVDAFGQIRDKREAQKEAALSHCLICNARREELDDKFDQHTKVRHPLDNYVQLFIYALRRPMETETEKQISRDEIVSKPKAPSRATSTKAIIKASPSLGDPKDTQMDPIKSNPHNEALLAGARSDSFKEDKEEEKEEVVDADAGRVDADGAGAAGAAGAANVANAASAVQSNPPVARPQEDEPPFDNLPILRQIQRQLRPGGGGFLPSWQLHQADINSNLLDLHLEAELNAIEEQFRNPHYWNLAMPPTRRTGGKSSSS